MPAFAHNPTAIRAPDARRPHQHLFRTMAISHPRRLLQARAFTPSPAFAVNHKSLALAVVAVVAVVAMLIGG